MKISSFLIFGFFLFLIFQSYFFMAFFLYLLAGFLWLFYEKHLPVTHKSFAILNASGMLFLYFFWPLRLFILSMDYLSKERYHVYIDKEIKHFANWAKACEYATKEAKQKNTRVVISDQAKLVRLKYSNNLFRKTWEAFPDGKIVLIQF